MALFTSAASGNFASGGTWVGGVAPTSADTFLVAAGHTVTVAADATSAGGTVESLTGGGLINNAKLTMNGHLNLGNGSGKDGCFTFGPGSELALGANNLVLNNSQLRSTATTSSWAKVTGTGSLARGAVYAGPKQDILLSYVSFQNTGEVKLSASGQTGGASLTNQVDCSHCAIIGASNIFFGHGGYTPATTSIKFNDGDIRDYTGSLGFFGNNPTTGVREFKRNTASISDSISVRGLVTTTLSLDLSGTVFDRVRLNGSDYVASHTGNLFLDGVFFGSGRAADDFTNTFGIALMDSGYGDNSYIYIPPSAVNPHTTGIASNSRWAGNVFEIYGTEPNVITSGTTTKTGTVNVVNNVAIGHGAFFNQVGSCTASVVNVDHNTIYTVGNSGEPHQGLFLAENGNMTGTLNIRSNVHVVKSGVSLARSCWDNDSTPQAINADYNTFNGLTSTPYESTLTVTGATNDTTVDPQFVDATRCLTKWGAHLGVAETYAAAVGELLRMNGFDSGTKTQSATPSGVAPSDLVAWVRAGFAPTNAALQGAGHDSVTVGAMEYSAPVGGTVNVWVHDSLTKFRQDGEDGTSGPVELNLVCGRNDFESFQILIYADGEDVSDVDVSFTAFSDGVSDTLPAPTVYKQHYVDCTDHVSRVEFDFGMYPDALIPKVDTYYGETRNAFPFTVTNGKVQGIWVDVGTLTDSTPGIYSSTATIVSGETTLGAVTINISVRDFEIPSTSTFQYDMLWDGGRMAASWGHPYWSNTTYFKNLAKQFTKLGLRHRLSLRASNVAATTENMVWDGVAKTLTPTTWEPFISWEAPGFSGTLIPIGETYGGAKKNVVMPWKSWPGESASFPIEPADRPAVTLQFLEDFWDYLEANGYDPETNFFVDSRHDEPMCANTATFRGEAVSVCTIVSTLAEEVSLLNSGTFRRTCVHSARKTGLANFDDYGFYSRWFQVTTCPGWDRECGYSTPQPKSSDIPGRDYWLYMGCASTGCGSVGDENYSGQVDVCADAQALYNRLPGFLFYIYEATGSVYWSVNTLPADPWLTLWREAYDGYTNGDGAFVYPGIADGTGRTLGANTPIIGGTNDIPIESLRLKHWRDFLEDFEICRIAESKHGRAAVMSVVMRLFDTDVVRDTYWNLNMDADNFRSVRADLLTLAETDPVSLELSFANSAPAKLQGFLVTSNLSATNQELKDLLDGV